MSRLTAEYTVISNAHSRARKAQREITKLDVQKAKKYGTWSQDGAHVDRRTGFRRWRVDHATAHGFHLVCFFSSDRKEFVTAWWADGDGAPAPAPPVPAAAAASGVPAAAYAARGAETHLVVVVDASGSMGAPWKHQVCVLPPRTRNTSKR